MMKFTQPDANDIWKYRDAVINAIMASGQQMFTEAQVAFVVFLADLAAEIEFLAMEQEQMPPEHYKMNGVHTG